MAGAARKSKLTKYEVTVRREVAHTAVITVEARSLEEAEDIARDTVDSIENQGIWREGDVVDQKIKARVIR
jgi:hypothetical protein